MISQTPKSSTAMGWEDLLHPSALLSANVCKCSRLTELAGETYLSGIGCPFAVDDVVVWTDIEAKSLVATGEAVPASLVELQEVLPSPEAAVALDDGREVWFEGYVGSEDGGRIERGGGHGCRQEKE